MWRCGRVRKLDNWLKGYAEYTAGTESPPIFHLWVALGTLAGAAQRKIFLDLDYYQVHTNMFVVLVAPPGRSRKSTALRTGKNILKEVLNYGQDIHFSTQSTSAAALIKQMSAIKTKEHQSLTAYSSEFGSLLGSKSTDVSDFLTDIYDCDPDWDKQTISRSLEKIEKPWLNIIAATTPQWMGDNLSKTAIEGGFLARCIFIYEETRLLVAFPKLTEDQKKIQRFLYHDLAEVAKLQGQFRIPQGSDAYKYYEDWYNDPSRQTGDTDLRISGYFERKHIHVLKVAMGLSLAEGDTMELSVDNIGQAIDMLTELEPGMRRAFGAVGKNIHSGDYDRLRQQIIRSAGRGMTYKQIIHSNIHSVDKDVIDKLLFTLLEAGDIVRAKDGKTFFATGAIGG